MENVLLSQRRNLPKQTRQFFPYYFSLNILAMIYHLKTFHSPDNLCQLLK